MKLEVVKTASRTVNPADPTVVCYYHFNDGKVVYEFFGDFYMDDHGNVKLLYCPDDYMVAIEEYESAEDSHE